MPEKNYKTFGETVGARAFPGAIDTKLESVLDVLIIVMDFACKDFQHGEVAIILYELPNTSGQFTCVCGGDVVRSKLKEAKEEDLLPLMGVIQKPAGERYYDIV